MTPHTHPGETAPIRHGGPVRSCGQDGGDGLTIADSGLAAEGTDPEAALCDGLPVRKAPAGSCPPVGAARNRHIRVSRAAFAAMWNNPRFTTDDIATAFGIHRSTVAPTGRRFGLPPRHTGPKPVIPREPFASWWLAGVLGSDICREMGLCRNYPGVLAKRFGLPPRGRWFRAAMTLDDYRALQLREALAARAREEEAAIDLCEMRDGRHNGGGRRAA